MTKSLNNPVTPAPGNTIFAWTQNGTKEVKPVQTIIQEKPSSICWYCGHEMIWGGDFTFEDYGIEGEGIVANLSCPNCGAYAEFYTGEKDS